MRFRAILALAVLTFIVTFMSVIGALYLSQRGRQPADPAQATVTLVPTLPPPEDEKPSPSGTPLTAETAVGAGTQVAQATAAPETEVTDTQAAETALPPETEATDQPPTATEPSAADAKPTRVEATPGSTEIAAGPTPAAEEEAPVPGGDDAPYPAPDGQSAESGQRFKPQLGSPRYLAAFAHAEKECGWTGIAGQVLDQDGSAADGVAVIVTGVFEGEPIERAGLSVEQNAYGPGGYEVMLADHQAAGKNILEVQLYNLQSQALSDPVRVVVPNACDKNLVLVNFQAGYTPNRVYLPFMMVP